MNVHDKGWLEDESREEYVEHEVRIHAGNFREVLQEAELVDIARGSKGKTETNEDDSVRDGGVLQDMAHQSWRKKRNSRE